MAQAQEQINVTVRRTIPLMGSQFEITVVAQNEEIGYINIQEAAAEIERIEKLISSWDPKSQTSSINRNAGIRPVKVSEELFKLIERAVQISEITYGAFDISYAALDQLWRFDGSMKYLPSSAEVKRTVDKVGYKKIVLKPGENTVYLKEKGMRIGFGAIGKGYAADKAKELLVSKQVPAGMINAAGDITTWGAKATGEKWLIGVDNPTGQGVFFSWLPLVESSVAITGNHSNYVTLDGKRYTHVINPKTGYPAMGLKKVTVLAKSAELCDALSTAVYVMGKKLGLALINQLDGTEVVILDDNDEVYKSNGILP
ncbi:FAD:protein FMN transferase [Muriicola sp. Z0-33]|nr:FAD:protein FMN transferase [Muriicola sp. Z0-33]